MKYKLKGPHNTHLTTNEALSIIGETFAAIIMYIDDNTTRPTLVTLENTSIFINFDATIKTPLTPHSCYWLRVIDNKPTLHLIGLDKITKQLNLPASNELANPNFFHWLKKICITINIIGDKLEEMIKNGILNLQDVDVSDDHTEITRENNYQLSRGKKEIANNIDFQHILDLEPN